MSTNKEQPVYGIVQSMPIAEKRNSVRYLIRTEVVVEWNAKRCRVLVSDISTGGLFIRTTEMLALGSEFEATLFIGHSLHIHCVVRHVVRARGIGVQFIGLTDDSRLRLHAFISG